MACRSIFSAVSISRARIAANNSTLSTLSNGLPRRYQSTGECFTPCRPTSGVAFDLEHVPGTLMNALECFKRHNVNLTRIESKTDPLPPSTAKFHIHFEGDFSDADVNSALIELKMQTLKGRILHLRKLAVPWFPTRMTDIDLFSRSTLDAGTELESDHPGFHDPEYRKRREVIAQRASTYRSGDPLPEIEYTEEENGVWKEAMKQLSVLFPSMACDEYNKGFKDLLAEGVFTTDKIPQLSAVSKFLHSRTGFVLRPVTGLLSGRDFLNSLAFRVFFSTQYIRHHSTPLYTPEPDIVHELIGHAPMLSDPNFADFTQLIGLASLGASDKEIKKLATCYWFSVEFGLLFQDGALKAYGAGILSSFGELQFATSPTNNKVKVHPWNPLAASSQEYPITTYQPVLFAANSLKEAKELMLDYCDKIQKPFSAKYDPVTQTVSSDVNVTPRPASLSF